jgi:hypothetical protein
MTAGETTNLSFSLSLADAGFSKFVSPPGRVEVISSKNGGTNWVLILTAKDEGEAIVTATATHDGLPTDRKIRVTVKRRPQGWVEDNDVGLATNSTVSLSFIWIRTPDLSDGYRWKGGNERGVWVGQWEVTERQYEAVMRTNPAALRTNENHDDLPVESVTWMEATNFCAQLTDLFRTNEDLKGFRFDLPTRKQSDQILKVCLPALTNQNSLAQYVRYNTNITLNAASGFPLPIGNDRVQYSGKSGSGGLHDVFGNVWEWVWNDDRNDGVARGGGCDSGSAYFGQTPRVLDKDQKSGDVPGGKAAWIGFRVVLTPD